MELEDCTKTRSVLNILGPIAEKILLLDLKKGSTCSGSTVVSLLKQCKSLKLGIEHLEKKLLSYSKLFFDSILNADIKDSCCLMVDSINELIEATKNLHECDIPLKNIDDAWNDISQLTEALFKGLVQSLLAVDQAQLRNIEKNIEQLQQHFNLYANSKSLDTITMNYQDLICKLADVYELVLCRSCDISNLNQKEAIHLLLLEIHNLCPLLTATVLNSLKFDINQILDTHRSKVLRKITDLTDDLKLQCGLGSTTYNHQEPASFINAIDGLFSLIGTLEKEVYSSTIPPILQPIKSPLETVLKHVIGMTNCCDKHSYATIMTSCETVLSHMKVISAIENGELCDPIDLEVALQTLLDLLEILELKANTSLIRLIVKSLTDPFSIIDSLLSKLNTCREEDEATNSKSRTELISLTENLEAEMDLLFQIGGFTIASTNDLAKVRMIESSLCSLQWLEGVLLTEVLSASVNPDPHYMTTVTNMTTHFKTELLRFRRVIDLLMDPSAFVLVTKQEVHEEFSQIYPNTETIDGSKLLIHFNRIMSLSQRLLILDENSPYLEEEDKLKIKNALHELEKKRIVLNCEMKEAEKLSLSKRLKLMLSILSSLSSKLNRDNMENFTLCDDVMNDNQEVDNKYVVQQSDEADSFRFVSRIENLSVDMCSPLPSISYLSPLKNKKTLQSRRRSYNRTEHSENENVKADLVPVEASGDVSKFLVRRVHDVMRSSTRNSKRNFSLKIKEISMDIGTIIPMESNAGNQIDVRKKSATENDEFKDTVKNFTGILGTMETLTKSIAKFSSQRDEVMKSIEELDLSNIDHCEEMSKISPNSRRSAKKLSSTGISDQQSTMEEDSNGSFKFSSTPIIDTKNIPTRLFTSMIATNSVESLKIMTPERMGDLKVVHMRLAVLKAMYGTDN